MSRTLSHYNAVDSQFEESPNAGVVGNGVNDGDGGGRGTQPALDRKFLSKLELMNGVLPRHQWQSQGA